MLIAPSDCRAVRAMNETLKQNRLQRDHVVEGSYSNESSPNNVHFFFSAMFFFFNLLIRNLRFDEIWGGTRGLLFLTVIFAL